MTLKEDIDNLAQRLNGLAGRFEQSARRAMSDTAREGRGRAFQTAWDNLRHLFSSGVTGENLRDMMRRDVRDTMQFYTREIDFAGMRRLPAWKRLPLAGWKVFAATAYRLSPPRRVAFAVAVFAALLGALEFLRATGEPARVGAGIFWSGLSILLLILLLLMEVRDKLDLKGDLEVAREIQLSLVPSGHCERGRVSVFSFMRTANTVGGDYHDIIDLDGDRFSLIVGDVAGKGMPAALLMALLQGSLRTLQTAGLRGADLMTRLNQYLFDNIPANRLVTLFYAELSRTTGSMKYVNAGHNAPLLLRRDGRLERLGATSVVMGAFRDACFEEHAAAIEPGDRLFLYTDGLTEAFNTADEEYGEERVARFFCERAGGGHLELIEGLVQDVLKFCGDAKPTDDMTLVSLRMRE